MRFDTSDLFKAKMFLPNAPEGCMRLGCRLEHFYKAELCCDVLIHAPRVGAASTFDLSPDKTNADVITWLESLHPNEAELVIAKAEQQARAYEIMDVMHKAEKAQRGSGVIVEDTDRPFEVGDLVRLKSYGPLMTVTEVFEKNYNPTPMVKSSWWMVRCAWFGDETATTLYRGEFPLAALDRKTSEADS